MSSGTKIPFFSSLEFHENASAIPLSQKIALCHRWGGVFIAGSHQAGLCLPFPKFCSQLQLRNCCGNTTRTGKEMGKRKGQAVGFYTGKPIPRFEALNQSTVSCCCEKPGVSPAGTTLQGSFPAQGKSLKSYSTKNGAGKASELSPFQNSSFSQTFF